MSANAHRISTNDFVDFGLSPIDEEGSRSNLLDFSDLTKSNLPQPEFITPSPPPPPPSHSGQQDKIGKENCGNSVEMVAPTPTPKQQNVGARPFVPVGQIIHLGGQIIHMDRNIEQTMMEISSTFHHQEEQQMTKLEDKSVAMNQQQEQMNSMEDTDEVNPIEEEEEAMVTNNNLTFNQREQKSAMLLAEMEQKMAKLQNELNEKEMKLNGQEMKLNEQEMTIGEKERILGEKERIIGLLEKKLAAAEFHMDSFEDLEAKMLSENFRLKKELLKLKVKFQLISAEEAAKELGCGCAEFFEMNE